MPKNQSVVTLGTFDGVHRGHQQILKTVVDRARKLRGESIALAFGMPPKLGHTPSTHPVLLTTLPEKIELLKRLGIKQVQVLVFNKQMASIPAETFFTQRILKRCQAKEMVVGPRVAFGKDRTGRLPLLTQLGQQHDVKIHVVPGVRVQGKPVSSSEIRAALYRGDVEKAARQLGYFYSVSGRVVHGDHRGRQLGYPTANVSIDPRKILPPGVFWVKVFPKRQAIPYTAAEVRKGIDGLCNVGTRPTFAPDAHKLVCEVFLFKTPSALYGRSLQVVFMRRIRSEKRFSTPAALKRQITADFAQAKKWAS